ncbi:scavenger receptor cysteine-rich domain-containing protein SCART1-like [Amazona ochrocephala]
MVPARVLGALLWVQLSVGQPWSTPEPQAELSTAQGPDGLRLVGGGGRCAGRVEVKHEGEWGSVCSYDFDVEALWAPVVCRQLGCGTAAKSSPYAPFGQGTGRIWLHIFFCRGDEAMLQDCPHFGWGQHFCSHERDVGVTCTDALELRLVNGSGPCAGKVEAKLRGRWGAVADDAWSIEDAEVVCQQLGCGSATRAYIESSHFGLDDSPVNLVLVNCRGHEKVLWDCEVRGWGPYNGIHDFDTAVVCQGFSRLVGGDGSCAGRLEVRQGRAWVGVCEDAVDMNAAQVVCRELGCGTVLAVPGTGLFGAGSVPQWETGFECTGTELLLSACRRQPPRTLGCTGHASIICSCKHRGHRGVLGVPPRRCHPPNPLCATAYSGFRLTNHSSLCAGRVEVMAEGTWGSVCASGWDLPDAHVLCHHLGCGPASAVLPGGSFGSGNGTLLVDAFGCSGSEQHPSECPVAVLGEPTCPPGHAAAVNCSGGCGSRGKSLMGLWGPPRHWERRNPRHGQGPVPLEQGAPSPYVQPEQCRDGAATASLVNLAGVAEPLRLLEGQSRCDGRLEVPTSPGVRAAVSAGLWDSEAATVVCRELGCGEPERVYTVPGSGAVWLQEVRCAGSEDSLAQCNVSAAAVVPGGIPQALAVVCSGECPGKAGGCPPSESSPIASRPCPAGSRRLRLAGGPGRCAGRVELYMEGTWSPVCEDAWDILDASVVCRQLGCGAALDAPVSAPFGPGVAPPWPGAGGCAGTEASLWDCPAPAQRGCRRGGGAGAVCSGQLSLRLAGGSGRCSGHLELRYNGTWGRVCASGTSPATAAAACRQLGCGDGGSLGAVTAPSPAPAWLAWVRCEDGARSLWRCPSAPWRLQPCGPGGDAHVVCAEDSAAMLSPTPGSRCLHGDACTDVPSATTPPAAAVPVPTVLCVVLGVLLCLTLGVLAVLLYRAWAGRRGGCRGTAGLGVPGLPALGRLRGWAMADPGAAHGLLVGDAVIPDPGKAMDAVYEELDYTVMPEYQGVPSRPGWCVCPHTGVPTTVLGPGGVALAHAMERWCPLSHRVLSPPGSPTEGSETKLPYYTAEDVEESDPNAAPGPPALPEDGPPDGYDDAEAVPEEPLGTGDTPEGVARAGGSRPPPGDTGDPPEQPPGDTGYDDADVGTLGTLL